MAIGIYKLTDSNGNVKVLNVPRFSGDGRLPGSSNKYTIKKATEELYEQFDHTATFFVNDKTIHDNMIKQGFINVVLSSDHTGEKWYFENGNFISFTLTSVTLTVHGKNGNYDRNLITKKGARTFISDKTNISWVSGTYGFYGRLTAIHEDGFYFNYYYPQNEENEESFNNIWNGNKPFEPSSDPYENGGGSTDTGGGTGNFDGESDSIDIPDLPTLSATDAGFITLYNPTQGQLHSLANYLWSDAFDLETFKKLYADPMSVILGLSIVPVPVPNGGIRTVTVGNRSTGVSMNLASSQYVSIDCGTLNVNEFWGGYLDYAPFTSAEIYLPYIGTHPIATDDIMGKPVHVVYHVDILSGACCAYVKCGSSVLYSFIGQCSSSIPISGNDWTNVINGVISIAGSIGSMVATGGMSAPMEIGNIASNAVNASKPQIEKSGALGGTGGMLNVQKPYLILTRPKQAVPAHQNNYTGYPSFITENFSNLTGYTEVYKTHLENIPATDAEISEIESLLKSGVIF